jgi:tetratricopeptide (TPR) repeat protein
MDELLRQGVAAARAGQREQARDLLMRVLEQDDENISAWLWLSGVVDSLEDQEICLENVLALDPNHDSARQGLSWVRQQQEKSERAIPPAASPDMSAKEAPLPAAATPSLAGAVLREDFAQRRPPPEAEPEPAPVPLRDEFDDEYLCPFCAGPTDPDDRKCVACGNKLWVKMRRREQHSTWLWVALTLQFAAIIWPVIILLIGLFYAASRAGLEDFLLLLPTYLGLPSQVPAEIAQVAFEALPRIWVSLAALFILFSLAVLIGLYLRWRPVFYLFLLSALLTLGLAVVGMIIGLSLPGGGTVFNQGMAVTCSGGGVIVAFLMFLLVLQITDDFFFDEQRLLLRQDRDATNGPALLDSGRRYAKQSMWAMAAIHLRRATGLMPQRIDTHLALSAAYLNLKRHDLAASALEAARNINPNHPQIEYLSNMLTSRQPTQSS